MEIQVLDPNLALPDLLDSNGQLKILHVAEYEPILPDALRLFCHQHARYGLPTIELVHWLKDRIANRKAIEIGSGAGDLAHALAIPATDNRMQEWPTIRLHYELTGQPVIRYPDFVQDLDALDAIRQYQPEVVVASWVTEWIDPNQPPPETGVPGDRSSSRGWERGGNAWGVKEDEILATGCVYILIGNIKVHGHKKIMASPHEEFALPFLRSQAIYPQLDRVWVWE